MVTYDYAVHTWFIDPGPQGGGEGEGARERKGAEPVEGGREEGAPPQGA